MEEFAIKEDELITNNSFLHNASVAPALMLPNESANETSEPELRNTKEHRALMARISDIYSSFNEKERAILLKKLEGHYGLYESGELWLDLEAVWLLNLCPLDKESVTELPERPLLHPSIKLALSEGRHVPIQHILHALHIAQFEPQNVTYPLSFAQVVPYDFIEKINRSDVLRGVNVHALYLGTKFPAIGAQFASIIEKLWDYMFRKRYSAKAGMEFYNEIFFEFTCRLGTCEVLTLDKISSKIEGDVMIKFKPCI